jgi:hypothetical protein
MDGIRQKPEFIQSLESGIDPDKTMELKEEARKARAACWGNC